MEVRVYAGHVPGPVVVGTLSAERLCCGLREGTGRFSRQPRARHCAHRSIAPWQGSTGSTALVRIASPHRPPGPSALSPSWRNGADPLAGSTRAGRPHCPQSARAAGTQMAVRRRPATRWQAGGATGPIGALSRNSRKDRLSPWRSDQAKKDHRGPRRAMAGSSGAARPEPLPGRPGSAAP